MAGDVTQLPPPPDGFVMDAPQQPDSSAAVAPPPPGFVMDGPPPVAPTHTANRTFAQVLSDAWTKTTNLLEGGPLFGMNVGGASLNQVLPPTARLEAALNVGSGIVTGFPAYFGGGTGGLIDKYALGRQDVDPKALAESFQNALTYHAKTEGGKVLTEAVSLPLTALASAGKMVGEKTTDIAMGAGASDNTAAAAGAITDQTLQMLPMILLGEAARKMNGQVVAPTDMQNVAKVVAGDGAPAEHVQAAEASLRSIYEKTGIGPFTVLEEARKDPQIAADLTNPDVDVPRAFQQFVPPETNAVEQMQNVRPLEADTPVPAQATPTVEESPEISPEEPQSAPIQEQQPTDTEAFPTRSGESIVEMNLGINPGDISKNVSAVMDDIRSTDTGQKAAAAMEGFVRDVQMKTTPMAAGSDRAMATAKDAANALRLADWQWSKFDEILKKGFTKEQREKMWNAADEENMLRTQGVTDETRGLGRLTDDERATVETLSQYGNQLLERAKAVGMFNGEGVAYWTPRVVAMIGEDGEVTRVPSGGQGASAKEGKNITTSASSLKQRKYGTVEETEAAAKAKFGENAAVVRDIRTMPLAMARIERAIAGRELVNRIKEIGLQTGQELVSNAEKPEFFTIDHPAFKTYRPKMVENEYGKWEPAKDQNGEMMFEQAPLYISKEFEGPLKAIMTEPSGKAYQAFMALKGKTMGLIMYSPLIHNMVEWGRALPMMPGKVLTGKIYFEGYAAKNDAVTMRRAIDAGLVPIGHRAFMQDITGIAERPEIAPGRSITAKAAGAVGDLAGKSVGNAVRSAIDAAGDFWHNTLLWDRVADLQMGLFTNLERDMVRKGVDPQTASRMAAHFANRYAGALPNEAMSAGARKLANIALFSRTFTLGNIGAMKDMVTGLPKDVQAQILRDAGAVAREAAVSAARRKALTAFAMDVGLLYVGNALLQNVMDVLKRDQTMGDLLQGYADRFHQYLAHADTDPRQLLNLSSLFPNSENEPGKENRILYGADKTGTNIYMRLPTGKIGEEMQGWLTHPLEMLKAKEGTIVRPLMQTLQNDKGFGKQVYDPNDPIYKELGNVVWNILQQQIPLESIEAGHRLMSGHHEEADALKTIGPLLGVTFSKGAPGGPEVGVMFEAEKQHRSAVTNAMPDIKRAITDGDIQHAIELMESVHMTPSEQRITLRYALNPQARINKTRLKKFEQISTPELKEKMAKLQEDDSALADEPQP